MIRVILCITAILLMTQSLAASSLNALSSAWKSHASTQNQKQAVQNHNDLTIVYGGEDIVTKSNIISETIAA